jgi:hypothetical protein
LYRFDDPAEVVEVDERRLDHRLARRLVVQGVEDLAQIGHVLGIHRRMRIDE